jgi:hypothetical protein
MTNWKLKAEKNNISHNSILIWILKSYYKNEKKFPKYLVEL